MCRPKQIVSTSPSEAEGNAFLSCCSASACTPNRGFGTVKQPDADLVLRALDMALEQRVSPRIAVSLKSALAIRLADESSHCET
jgi:hypothetical protein